MVDSTEQSAPVCKCGNKGATCNLANLSIYILSLKTVRCANFATNPTLLKHGVSTALLANNIHQDRAPSTTRVCPKISEKWEHFQNVHGGNSIQKPTT